MAPGFVTWAVALAPANSPTWETRDSAQRARALRGSRAFCLVPLTRRNPPQGLRIPVERRETTGLRAGRQSPNRGTRLRFPSRYDPTLRDLEPCRHCKGLQTRNGNMILGNEGGWDHLIKRELYTIQYPFSFHTHVHVQAGHCNYRSGYVATTYLCDIDSRCVQVTTFNHLRLLLGAVQATFLCFHPNFISLLNSTFLIPPHHPPDYLVSFS